MFDGNFRARKEVNLSGGGRRRGRTTTGKQSVLKNAELKRRQRLEHQRQTKAAKNIQRSTRGWLTRLRILGDLLPKASQSLAATSKCLSSLQPWLYKHSTTSTEVLCSFVVSSFPSSASDDGADAVNMDISFRDEDGEGTDTGLWDSAWFSRKRLVHVALQQMNPKAAGDASPQRHEEQMSAMFFLLQKYRPTVRMDNLLYLDLALCLSKWIKEHDPTHDENADALSSSPLSPSSLQVTRTLCDWAINASHALANPNARALLASILFGSASNTQFVSTLPGDTYETWMIPLAEVLDANTADSGNSGNPITNATCPTSPSSDGSALSDPVQRATWKNLQGGKERRILTNVLEDASILNTPQPRALLKLIHHVLAQNSNGDLTLIASLLVRGDIVESRGKTGAAANAPIDLTGNEDESDTEEDDFDEEETTEGGTSSHESTSRASGSQMAPSSKKYRSNARFSKKDLLTLPKLDKLYQDQIQQRKRDCKAISSTSSTILSTAKTLVKAPWLNWGLQFLDASNGTGANKSNWTDAQLFVETLALLMQATTSLRPNTKVGVMSKLAFNRPFLLKLWNWTRENGDGKKVSSAARDLALGVFCDLFAHYLVALSDVDFLRFHTQIDLSITDTGVNGTPVSSTAKGVLAPEIIRCLRTELYELYWNKPVLTSEVVAQEARGRLLLAATKVWNSLYERWNRLVRNQSFCDESSWWFPYLASREGDGAVVPDRERAGSNPSSDGNEQDDDDDSMDVDDDEEEDQGMSTADAEADALADAFRDPKMARVLTCIPQALPFGRRVKLFHSLLKADKQKMLQAAASRRSMMALSGNMDPEELFFDGSIRERVTIRRAQLYKDSMQQLNELGRKLKHKVQVSFVNQHGAEEAGIDGGGVFKEFLDDLIKDGFAAKGELESESGAPSLFSVTPLQTLAVNYDISHDQKMLIHYEFLGRVLGKAVYESILVEPQFCLPFLNQLLGKTNSMEDLKNYDEEYYKNLNKLKGLSDTEVEALGLNFEVTVAANTSRGASSPPRTVELMPGGRSVPVKTKAQIFQYMHAVANQLLNIQGARQTKAFLRGFRDLIPAPWVRLFSANELQKLISGDDSVRGIDVDSLRRAMSYLGGYHPSQPYIHDFWDIIEKDLTAEQQRKFLRFMTSCSRQPLLGFSSLDPVPSIQQIRLTDEQLSKNSKLPTSQTCMNLLKLPNYKDKALLREKLLAAIESGAGFELT